MLDATGLQLLQTVGGVYLPRMVSSTSALYGTLGVVFAILARLLISGLLDGRRRRPQRGPRRPRPREA